MDQIRPSKWDSLHEEMEKYQIYEDDLVEKFILGSGSGGQKINKTNSCVYIKHLPTGFEVKCQKTRSREQNRFHARRELVEKVKGEIFHEETKRKKEADKVRKQKKRRSRKSKEKMLEEKHRRGEVKEGRKSPGGEGD